MKTGGILYHVPAHAALTQRLSHTPSSALLMESRTLNGTVGTLLRFATFFLIDYIDYITAFSCLSPVGGTLFTETG
jgi:hypothetical protein